jgi:hypothetical protein
LTRSSNDSKSRRLHLRRNGASRPDMAALTCMIVVVSGPVLVIVSGNALRQSEIEGRIAFSVDLFLNGAKVERRP